MSTVQRCGKSSSDDGLLTKADAGGVSTVIGEAIQAR
jgi:hypothetical protein